MNTLLFKVEDCHNYLCGDGCVVQATGISSNQYESTQSIRVLLKFPDGSQSIEQAEILYPHPAGGRPNAETILPVCFPQVVKESLPIGTEVWLVLDDDII